VKTILAFLAAIPELLKLVAAIRAEVKEAAIKRRVKDDVIKIREAFEAKDASKLNSVFNPPK